jgi:hypothetical protein
MKPHRLLALALLSAGVPGCEGLVGDCRQLLPGPLLVDAHPHVTHAEAPEGGLWWLPATPPVTLVNTGEFLEVVHTSPRGAALRVPVGLNLAAMRLLDANGEPYRVVVVGDPGPGLPAASDLGLEALPREDVPWCDPDSRFPMFRWSHALDDVDLALVVFDAWIDTDPETSLPTIDSAPASGLEFTGDTIVVGDVGQRQVSLRLRSLVDAEAGGIATIE